ncbi:MAG TPA: hypothetical protein VFS43_42705 [Polyangiaceae bacterium]|nr:hypothetical protein [Polyangiaceae bacterium]
MTADECRDHEDIAWLAARSRGEAAEHPDPARAAAYVRLEQALAALPLPASGRAWQAEVFAAIDARARARRLAFFVGSFAAAAALVVAAWWWRPQPVEGAFAPLVVVAPRPSAGGPCRGNQSTPGRADGGELPPPAPGEGRPPAPDELRPAGGGAARASLGDVLAIEAWLSGPGELRVYRDGDELVLRCPGGDGCAEAHERRRRVLKAGVTLRAPGRYRAVLLGGVSLPSPPPSEREQEGLGAAAGAGAKVVDSIFVDVR